MKLKTLLSACAVMFSASAFAQTVLFDFHDPNNILGQVQFQPFSFEDLQAQTYVNASDLEKARAYFGSGNKSFVTILEGETMVKDGVKITPSNPDKYKDFPRIFFARIDGAVITEFTAASGFYPLMEAGKLSGFYSDFRWYQKEEILIQAPEGKKLDKVVITAKYEGLKDRDSSTTIVVSDGGTQTISEDKAVNTWTANEGSTVTELKYKASDTSATQMAYTVEVSLSDASGAGVAQICAEENEETVYYDLTGNRVTGKLTKGIYLCRKGNVTNKIIVK